MWTPLNEKQHSVKLIYIMILHITSYAIAQVETIVGKVRIKGEREQERKKCWS